MKRSGFLKIIGALPFGVAVLPHVIPDEGKPYFDTERLEKRKTELLNTEYENCVFVTDIFKEYGGDRRYFVRTINADNQRTDIMLSTRITNAVIEGDEIIILQTKEKSYIMSGHPSLQTKGIFDFDKFKQRVKTQ